jgi:L-aspartate oxidase
MQTNFLVIGSGVSGLNFALHAAQKGHVTIVTKKRIAESNTNYAQGGIAAVLSKNDNFKKHIQDTMKSGAYHNDKKAVRFMVEKSPEAITRLITLGVEFEKEKDRLKLTSEGGHQLNRIAYTGDYTGNEIESILVKRVREHPNIEVFENTFAVDLIRRGRTIHGAKIITRKNRIDTIFADAVIIATGGAGQVYKYTTNPAIATGDGIAMAARAGAKLQNLEFIQFHPTALAKASRSTTPRLLLSETLRGEGAKLLNSKGRRFTDELASRNIVAKEIYQELRQGPVYLSIRQKSRKFLQKRFPRIYKTLRKYKLDLKKDLIPVVPVAHYLCGGIKTDLNGRTSLRNLYTFGESACTGVHGANRLASNSLLEAIVFSNQVIKAVKPLKKSRAFSFPHEKFTRSPDLAHKVKTIRKQAQETMWKHCGIIRTPEGLKQGIIKLKQLQKDLTALNKTQISRELLETKNLLETSLLIMKAAKKRKKSLGCHFVG